jgi:hypothetical protein
VSDGQSDPDHSARTHQRPNPHVSTDLPALTRIQAIALCDQVRAANRGRWWSAAWWQCWGCIRSTGGTEDAYADKRCIGSAPGYRGCALVNALADHAPPPLGV